MRLKLGFHVGVLTGARGCQLGRECGQPLSVGRFSPALPNMVKNAFTHIAVGQTLRLASHRQTQQRQRVERVRGGHVQHHLVLLGQPLDLAIRPFAFARNLSRAQLTMVLEQRGK